MNLSRVDERMGRLHIECVTPLEGVALADLFATDGYERDTRLTVYSGLLGQVNAAAILVVCSTHLAASRDLVRQTITTELNAKIEPFQNRQGKPSHLPCGPAAGSGFESFSRGTTDIRIGTEDVV